jgi:endo-1,4-beta-xylanase
VRSLVVGLVAAIAAGCTTTTPSAVSSPAPSVVVTAPAASSTPPDWSVVQASDLNRLVLGCVPGIEQSGDKWIVRSTGDGFAGGITRLRPWIETRGDFGAFATIGGDTESPADLSLIGALSQGPDFWQGLKRIDIGVRTDRLAIFVYTGEKREAAIARSFAVAGVARPARVGVRRIGSELAFRVNGSEVGRIQDPGLFAAGLVHLGVSVGPRTTMTISDLAVEAPPSGSGSVAVVPGFLDAPPAGTSLRSVAAARSFRIGAFYDAIGADPNTYGFLADPVSRRTLAREYNHLTVGAFQSALSPARDRYAFCESDAVVAFGRAHGMEMRAQTLVYTHPQWLAADTFSRDQLSEWVHSYISTVVGRYRGQIREWEVANELFDFQPKTCTLQTKDGGENAAFWVRNLGTGWVDQAFRWAREADPEARLYYNENRAEGLGLKSDCVYAMVKGMKERGVPIDGVGMQSHWIIPEAKQEPWNLPPLMESVAPNMKRYADIGLSVQVTEIDVKVGRSAGAAELASQARVYADMLGVCLAAPNCSAFTSWGVSDRYSWVRGPVLNQPWEKPLPFDDDFRPKPAYNAMIAALRK